MMQDPVGRRSPSDSPLPFTPPQPDGVTVPAVARHYVNGVIAEFVEDCLAGKITSPLLLQFQTLPQDDLRRQIYEFFQRKTGRTTVCETACHGGLYRVRIELKGREGIEMTFLGLKRSEPPPMSEL